MIDIGLNLTNSQFKDDQSAVVQSAHDVGVTQMIVTGTDVAESHAAYALANTSPNLYSTAGVHPHDAKSVTADYIDQLEALLEHERVIAVGECGLDFNRNYSPQDIQIDVFNAQLQLSAKVNKPLFLHERDAYEVFVSCIEAVKQTHNLQGVVHCFTGSKQALTHYLDLGFYIGVTGWVCDERRGDLLRELVRFIPEDRLLIETDSPFLLPRDLKPKPKSRRNEPKYLPHIAQTIADLRRVSFDDICMQTFKNAQQLFSL